MLPKWSDANEASGRKMISDPKEGDIHQLKRVLLGANLMPCGRRRCCPYL